MIILEYVVILKRLFSLCPFFACPKKERKKRHFLEGGSQATMVPFALHAMVSPRPQFQAMEHYHCPKRSCYSMVLKALMSYNKTIFYENPALGSFGRTLSEVEVSSQKEYRKQSLYNRVKVIN